VKVGIYGGTFNPPHIGHERAAKAAANQLGLDLLVIVPVGVPPHKPLPPGSPSADVRLFMTHTAFYKARNTIVSNIEVTNLEPSFTIETVSVIGRIYPDAELFLLLGTDIYLTLETWKDYVALLGIVTLAVFSRGNDDVQRIRDYASLIEERYGATTKMVMNTVVPISSSGLRDMLPKRGGLGYINDTNYSYIIKNGLYGARADWNWLRERAYSMLSPSRIQHVTATETAALSLARRWGVDLDDAREASILHDITKKFGLEAHMRVFEDYGFAVGALRLSEEKLLHAKTGALLAKAVFGVSDEVENAIKWHTTGRAGMSTLEKVLYLADYIEATRDFPGVEELRRAAYESLGDAMAMGLEMTIADVTARGIHPDQATIDALNDIRNGLKA